MADTMCAYAKRYYNANEHQARVLNQMARELLLAQSSDWAFLMTTKTASEYSTARTKEHIYNFFKLADMLEKECFNEEFFALISRKNSIFDFLDFRVYSDDREL